MLHIDWPTGFCPVNISIISRCSFKLSTPDGTEKEIIKRQSFIERYGFISLRNKPTNSANSFALIVEKRIRLRAVPNFERMFSPLFDSNSSFGSLSTDFAH